ncbi:hypothetical protein BGW36DRAFT_464696 [Talaromyces proteolyticus]|uniref:Protein kinase domain-containing protein n=1 Tax=Talaromyces proteolyticus TaxID=1131652 RepID=A0AAD4KK61_9EURO|nr:uncharacterized protein BGW36DRAFT_464696 [Talaromyces proteolyticus]KAH8692138.1 hypothetical protein BGW36DRAFT_464696 [Talaromyces proteolyticus]
MTETDTLQLNASRLKADVRLAQAVSEFKASISRDDKTKLQNILSSFQNRTPDASDVKQVIAEIDMSISKKSRRCFGPRLMNILEAVQQYASLGDVVLGASQNIVACSVWALVRMTLTMLTQSVTYLENLSILFMNAGRNVPRYHDMALLFPRSKRLQEGLCEYLIVVVNICQHYVKYMQKSFISQIPIAVSGSGLQKFQNSLTELADFIMREVTMLLGQKAVEEANEGSRFRKMITTFKENREYYHQLSIKLHWLEACSKHDYKTTWKQARKSGTTSWFTTVTEYRDWRDHQQTSSSLHALLCTGKLGSGKTVLIANMVDDLSLTVAKGTLAYFFCRYDIAESLTARNIIGCLARQLLDQQAIDMKELANRFGKESSPPDIAKILDILQSLVPRDPIYYFILDGLDECSEKEANELMEFLQTLRKVFKLRLCVSFRTDAGRQFKEISVPRGKKWTLEMPEENPDIGKYIESELRDRLQSEKLTVGNPAIILAIQEALSRGSQGMFLWTALQLDCLCAEDTDEAILQALGTLPKDLSEIFTRLLQKADSSSSNRYRQKIVELIISAHRPLTLSELQEALAVTPGETQWEPARLINNIRATLRCCKSLIIVDEEEETVRFAHHSIQKFFITPGDNGLTIPINPDEARRGMGRIILTYLNYDVFAGQMTRTMPPTVPITEAPSKILRSIFSESKARKEIAQLLVQSRKHIPYDISQVFAQTAMNIQSRSVREFPFLKYAKEACFYHISGLWQEEGMMSRLWNELLGRGHTGLVITDWVKFELDSSMLEGLGGKFVPRDAQDQILSPPVVKRIVDEYVDGNTNIHALSAFFTTQRTCLAILVYQKMTKHIPFVFNLKITDKDLPIQKSALTSLLRSRLRSPRASSDFNVDIFYDGQWPFVAPILSPKMHLEQEFRIMPLTPTGHKSGPTAFLQTASVHPAHHRFSYPYQSQGLLSHGNEIADRNSGPIVVIKMLRHQTTRNIYEQEFFKSPKAEHLVRHLASYRKAEVDFILFPLAKYNLEKFWNQDPIQRSDPKVAQWALKQMIGIANALEVAQIMPYPRTENGYHGNIEPKCILWFNTDNRPGGDPFGILQLNFNFAFPSQSKPSLSKFDLSETYRAPETQINEQNNKKTDVWSLGCVYIEFITWVLMGWSGIQQLRNSSKKHHSVYESLFFRVHLDPNSAMLRASLREEITSWVSMLQELPNCSNQISEALIHIMTYVMVVNPEGRDTASKLAYGLSNIMRSISTEAILHRQVLPEYQSFLEKENWAEC